MSRYTAKDIAVLEGLEPVRKRPGMYIGGTGVEGLHHLLWELVDNAVDEAINGFASTITVTLHPDSKTVTVKDNGRGIPVDIHPKRKVSALEVIFTTLHSGGKFDNKAYHTSGGLHGVGASVVNALSSHLEVKVKRDGKLWLQEFRRGRPKNAVEAIGPARGTGTSVTFCADPEVFEETTFHAEIISEKLEVKTFLNKGLRIIFRDQVADQAHEFFHEDGLSEYLASILERDGTAPIISTPFLHERDNGFKVEAALTWTAAPREKIFTFVNGIPTRSGGTHEQGMRDALVKALRNFMETHGLTPRGIQLSAEDLREGTVVLLSLFLKEPQFQGQTKDRLNNPEIRAVVDSTIRPVLEQWLHENKSVGETIIVRAIQAAKARVASRQAATVARKRSSVSTRLNLPGKLADCSNTDPTVRELFIVEGDSAGGSAKQGRNRKTQAILPLRGKVLNTEQATLSKVLANEELSNIVTALGCSMGTDFKEERLRYQRIILLMDADYDGHHITTLLLTFFYRYLRPLIERGYVYIAQPPLFRITVGKKTSWALDDVDREQILSQLPPRSKPEITRFKGLGEMPPKTLFETTLNPDSRRLLQVTLSDPIETESTVTELMGRDPAPRFRFIMDRAREVDVLDV